VRRLDADAAPVGSLLVDVSGPGRVWRPDGDCPRRIDGRRNLEPHNTTVRGRSIDEDSRGSFVLAER
jgi:hypothetical protein